MMSKPARVYPAPDSSAPPSSAPFEGQAGKSEENPRSCFLDDKTKESRWIRNNIKMRECSVFVQNQSTSECHCGYSLENHGKELCRARSGDDTALHWTEERNTRPVPTNSFGDIEFLGFGQKEGKYVRVDCKCSMDIVITLMTKIWDLDVPNLLISVTGGAKNFQMKPRLKEVFRKGLVKAALSTHAWVTSAGMNAGVMKHVGRAIRDYGFAGRHKVVAIGIAPWGCVQNKESLVEPSGKGKWPALYRLESENKRYESPLDPNHSHFILVDNGTQHEFGTEIEFRANLEKAIGDMKTNTGDNAVSVPVVLVMVEGGPGTLKTVYQSISNKTPTVLVKGSGRAADILANAYQDSAKEEEKCKRVITEINETLREKIEESVKTEFGETNLDERVTWICESLRHRDLVTVFELYSKDSAKDIDVAILKALLKANKGNSFHQLQLALVWNRIDVAKSEIFTDDKQWPTGSLDDIMLSAMHLDRVDFVKLFLEHGVSLKEFLTPSRFTQLYTVIPENSLLYILLEKECNFKTRGCSYENLLGYVGKLIQSLMGDYYQPPYLKQSRQKKDNINTIQKEDKEPDFLYPANDLFLWAILMNRQDMAFLFWEEGMEALASALVANKLLKSMKKKTNDSVLIQRFQEHASLFEERAIGVLNECYASDEKIAQNLLVRKLENWGNATCVLIAMKADNKRFISQTACQALLNRIWMGAMSQDNNLSALILCMICPPVILKLIKFEHNSQPCLDTTEQNENDDSGNKVIMENRTELRPAENCLTNCIQETKQQSKQLEFGTLSAGEKFFYFYNAPVITFCYNVIFYIFFLILYSYVLLVTFSEEFSKQELVLCIWVFAIFAEEVRQLLTQSSASFWSSLNNYICDKWNAVDVTTIFLFLVGIILRILPYQKTLIAARVIFSLNVIFFYFRVLHIFSVHKELGPKLVMIGKMLRDLMYFVVILLVFNVAYGIGSQAILYPNTQFSWDLFRNIFRQSYFQMYGELFLEEIEGSSVCTLNPILYLNNTLPRCPTYYGQHIVPIMLGVYILLTNVLLLNLLIAMFSNTFQKVQENTDQHWNFQRYNLILEYYTRPLLPPPLILFSHIYLIFKYFSKHYRKNVSGFEKIVNKKEEKRLIYWEDMIADTYLSKAQATVKNSIENKVKVTSQKVDLVISKLEELQYQQSCDIPRDIPHQIQTMSKKLDDLEGRIKDMHSALEIVKSMSDNKKASSKSETLGE